MEGGIAMPTKIFVNLPVKDLERSKAFFAKLGYSFNPQFTDERAACMVVGEDIYTMLLSEPFFKTFTRKEIADAAKATEVLVALTADSKEQVDEMLRRALAAGAKEAREPMEYEFMYGRSFEDLDGHIWEVFWMNPSAINQANAQHQ
jgi:predicted lactoylglutathione lyase